MEELINVVKAEVMSSLEIAEITGKKHCHVMRDIRNILSQGVQESNFGLSSRKQQIPNGGVKEIQCFLLTPKGCLILASGYNALLREKIVNRLEELEIQNRKNKTIQSYQIEDPIKRAERWIEEERERQRLQLENQKQEQLLIEQQPKVVLANAITASEHSFPIKELATILAQNGVKIGPTRLRRFLVDNHYLGSRGECYMMPRQRYIEQGLFEVIEELEYNSYYNRQELNKTVMVTGKGLKYFINKFLNNKK